jgi:ferredoxin
MTMRVHVNPIDCAAHGLCAELLPEWVELDEWGYPVVDEQPLPPSLTGHARRAAVACPVRAFLLEGD